MGTNAVFAFATCESCNDLRRRNGCLYPWFSGASQLRYVSPSRRSTLEMGPLVMNTTTRKVF